MLSVVIEVLKQSGNLCSFVHLSQIVVWYTATWLYITLHNSSARLDGIHPVQIHPIGIRDSTYHRRVCNKEVKFIRIYSLGPRFSVRCPYYRVFSGHWELSVIERCPYREVRLYCSIEHSNSRWGLGFQLNIWLYIWLNLRKHGFSECLQVLC